MRGPAACRWWRRSAPSEYSMGAVRTLVASRWESRRASQLRRSWRDGDRHHLRFQDRRCREGSGYLQLDVMPVPPAPLEQAAAQWGRVRTGADQSSPVLLQPYLGDG